MGLKSFLFGKKGGFGQDNPEYRNLAEWTAALQRIGLQGKQSPEVLKQYFSTGSGKEELNRLGYDSVDEIMASLDGLAPDVASSKEYGDIANEFGGLYDDAKSGFGSILKQLSGQGDDLQDYTTVNPQDLSFDSKSLLDVPDKAYADMQEMQEEQAARGFRGALESLGQNYDQRGFSAGSGFQDADGSSLGRGYLENLRNISRDVGMEKARAKQDMSKFASASSQDMTKFASASSQDMTKFASSLDMQRAQYLSDLQKYAKNFGLNKAQIQASIQGQKSGAAQDLLNSRGRALDAKTQSAMLPYDLGQDYYGMTNNMTGPAPRKGAFSDIIKTGANIAGKVASGGLF